MTPEPRLAARGWIPDPHEDIREDVLDAHQPDPAEGTDPAEPVGRADRTDPVDPVEAPEQLAAGVRHRRPPWWRRFGRGGRFVETWVPETLRDARVDPGRRGALVLSLVAALAAVAAAVGVWRDRPEPRPVQTISHSAHQQEAAPDTASRPEVPRSGSGSGRGGTTIGPRSVPSAASSPAVLAVSVTGAVHRPGLVRVRSGSRVADAIAAAGGITAEADITGLNVATVLVDGDSVVVATRGMPIRSTGVGDQPGRGAAAGPAVTPTGTPVGAPLDLNSADSAALEALPGVGPVMAGNIIAWREANGPFTAVDQLQEITGIGPARYAQLAPLVVVG